MYRLSLTDQACADLERLPPRHRENMLETLRRLESWPNRGCDVRKLKGVLAGSWRVRRGDYRAAFYVDSARQEILVTWIRPRERAYQ